MKKLIGTALMSAVAASADAGAIAEIKGAGSMTATGEHGAMTGSSTAADAAGRNESIRN